MLRAALLIYAPIDIKPATPTAPCHEPVADYELDNRL
jgi:hypothetical protein